jgi:hypothetical protein
MFRRALVRLPVHPERLVVEHLEPIHPDIARARSRIAGKHHGQRDVAPSVAGPALDDRERGERRVIGFHHFLTRRRADVLGPGLRDVEERAELLELVEEGAGHLEIEELRDAHAEVVDAFDAQCGRHPLGRAERIDQDRNAEPTDVLEEQGDVLITGRLRDAVRDLGDLQVSRHRDAHAPELSVLLQIGDELTEIGEGHRSSAYSWK